MSSTFIDTLYCTIDTSRVEEGKQDKAQSGKIRDAIERKIGTIEGQNSWRCIAATRVPKTKNRIKITSRDKAELVLIRRQHSKCVGVSSA